MATPRDPAKLTPARARVRRGFRSLRVTIGTPAQPPKSRKPGPRRPKGTSKPPPSHHQATTNPSPGDQEGYLTKPHRFNRKLR